MDVPAWHPAKPSVATAVVGSPINHSGGLRTNISLFQRRWLGLPKRISCSGLQLPFSSLSDTFKVAKAREVLIHIDIRVSTEGVVARTERKCRAQEAVEQAVARLQHSILVGSVAVGRAGLGSRIGPHYDRVQGRERQQLIQAGICAEIEEGFCNIAVALQQQGTLTNWDHASTWKITWTELWKSEPARLLFLTQAVCDVLKISPQYIAFVS